MKKELYPLFILLLSVFSFASCVDTKKATYFNNAVDTTYMQATANSENIIQKNDILSISITSLNADASAIFNTTNNFVINSSTATGGSSQSTSGYLVDREGFVQLPLLGNIRAANLTKSELKESITKTIIDKKLLVDPIVNIRHLNFEVTVIGEVGHPTVITVPNERISLMKAVGLAGDITPYGRKENVLLIREAAGKKTVTRIDLNSSSFFNSPYYYLQPNDIVYVESNKNKLASVNRGHQLLPSLIYGLSVVGVIIIDRLK